MTVTAPEQPRVAARGPAIDPSHRRTARIAGVLFVLTFVTAIAGGADPESRLLTGQTLVA
jgi:hypothetical protein